jgi:hypothetical protein
MMKYKQYPIHFVFWVSFGKRIGTALYFNEVIKSKSKAQLIVVG